jgi:hypothetical protein
MWGWKVDPVRQLQPGAHLDFLASWTTTGVRITTGATVAAASRNLQAQQPETSNLPDRLSKLKTGTILFCLSAFRSIEAKDLPSQWCATTPLFTVPISLEGSFPLEAHANPALCRQQEPRSLPTLATTT